jgi:hypothetical protein
MESELDTISKEKNDTPSSVKEDKTKEILGEKIDTPSSVKEDKIKEVLGEKIDTPPSVKEDKTKEALGEKIDDLSSIEEKILSLFDCMKKSLSRKNSPDFKRFWDAKNEVMVLFKEQIDSEKRLELWTKYIELNDEAKNLRFVLDDQSHFALEQIDIAIEALEKDVKNLQHLFSQIPGIDFGNCFSIFDDEKDEYINSQKELTLLNAFSSRIHSLRKELIKIITHSRKKNLLFKKLAALGEEVFPKRKKLIQNISTLFLGDIERFQKEFFEKKDNFGFPYYRIRQEIKFLQDTAKKLTINTKTFMESRKLLSECWDLLRELDNTRKKNNEKKKEVSQEKLLIISERIDSLKKEHNQVPRKKILSDIDELYNDMRHMELSLYEEKLVKKKIQDLKNLIFEKEIETKNEKIKKEQELIEINKKSVEEFEENLISLSTSQASIKDLETALEDFKSKYTQLNFSDEEKVKLNNLKNSIEDSLYVEKEEELISSTEEPSNEKVDKLNEILEKRKSRRSVIKIDVEEIRKDLAKSGYDFEKAMLYREILEKEKIRLKNIDLAISRLEGVIEDLLGN